LIDVLTRQKYHQGMTFISGQMKIIRHGTMSRCHFQRTRGERTVLIIGGDPESVSPGNANGKAGIGDRRI